MNCECELCKRDTEFRRRLTLLPDTEREYWEAMYFTLCNVEFDLDWYKAVHDGSWPGAVDILKDRLENAKDMLEDK